VDGSAVADSAGERAIGLRVQASDVTVRGLTIQNFAFDGVYVGPSQDDSGAIISGVTVTHNIVKHNLDGIRVSGSRGPDNWVNAAVVRNVLISNRDDGITVEGSLDVGQAWNEVHVTISGNRVTGSLGMLSGGRLTGDGIRVLGGRGGGSDNQVFADIMNNWTADNIDDGIVVAGAGGGAASRNYLAVRVLNNVVRNSGAFDSINGNGIVIRAGSRAGADPTGSRNTVVFELDGNHCLENKETGIVLNGGLGSHHYLHGVATTNWAKRNDLDGMRVTGGLGEGNLLSHIRVARNQLNGNLRDGLNINGGPGVSAHVDSIMLTKNRTRGNDRFGILLSQGIGKDNEVTVAGIFHNQAVDNLRDGLFVDAGASGVGETPIARNRSLHNGEDGIDVNADGYHLTGNRAIGNASDGINALGNIDGGSNLAIGNADCNSPGCY